MPPIIEGPENDDENRPLSAKLGWFVALWLFGLLATAALAYGLRFFIV